MNPEIKFIIGVSLGLITVFCLTTTVLLSILGYYTTYEGLEKWKVKSISSLIVFVLYLIITIFII